MDADSSYGGSDTAQDYHSAHENNSSFETSHNDAPHNHDQVIVTTTPVLTTQSPTEEMNNQFYHINEVTLPINYNENGYQSDESISPPKEPHYLSTANLNINETLEHHSNLEEMNKQYKSTSHLSSESPRGMRRANSGIDNMVFEDDVPDQANVKSTFDNSKPYNGELHPSLALGTNSHKHNEEPMTEAVNLELINLKPVGKDVTGHYENVGNGMTTIPLKRENDNEAGNPYDEYFVPVNEHRKYMRGEKLYVTMDKRGKKSKSKCLCWGICLCIVAAALIIGILAAVGVIGSQEPLKEASARNFDGTEPEIRKGSLFSSGKIPDNEPSKTERPFTTNYNMSLSTEMPIIQVGVSENQGSSQEVKGRQLDETEPKVYEDNLFISSNSPNTEPPTPFTPAPSISTVSNIPPSTEMSMIQVPRALDSHIIIDNIQFTPALADENSSEFKALATELRKEFKELLFSKDVLLYGPADIKIRVMEFVPDKSRSVMVNYRIVWIFKKGIHNPKDPIDKITLEKKMSQFLEESSRLIGPYHISEMPAMAEKILDLCKIDNNGCEHICLFDYDILDFACICAEGKTLSKDKKMCIDKPEPGSNSNSNTDLINNFKDEQDYYSKDEPNFETITTTQSFDSEFKKNLYYNIHSTPYSDIPPQSESSIQPESISAMSASTEQYLVQNTEKYVTEMISGLLDEKSTEVVANSNSETEPSNSEKIIEYSNSAIVTQTPTEYSLEHDNLSHIDTTTIVSNMANGIDNTFEITTNINMEENKNSEQLTVTPSLSAEYSLTNVAPNSTLNKSVETTTELLNEPTTERTGETTLEITSEYSENSSKEFNEEKQNDITDNILIQTTTNVTEKNTKSAYNENYTMPESTTYPYVLSEDKMNELGLLKVVTPEAEIYTTTDYARAPEFVDYNRIHKTLKEKSRTKENLTTINNTNKETNTENVQSTMEITTEMLSHIRENELHFIPVIVHEDAETSKTEIVPEVSSFTTEMASSFGNIVHVNVSEHYETNNERPKIYEVTTQQVSSEMKKTIENSTEKFSEQMNVVEHPENTPNDYMSPFLPEIENDTFANTLHSDDHFNDNLFISKHVDLHENMTEQKTNPPNLENDQMNHTNPLDQQQNDTYLGVLPLEHKNTENISTDTNHTDKFIPRLQKETNNPDDMTNVNNENIIYNENSNLNTVTESNPESTTIDVKHSTMLAVTEMTLDPLETTSTEREEITTDAIKAKYMSLPPEIINNVHSNNYFEDNPKIIEEKVMFLNDKITKELEVTTQAETEISTTQILLDMKTEYPQLTIDNKKNMRDDTSTEDLIASETTTNTFKVSEDENQSEDITSESNYPMENSTINGETIETATELVNFVTTQENDMSTEEYTTSASQTSTATFQSSSLGLISQYEVKESLADITTTEKLFLTIKPNVNIVTIVNQEDNEDLSIIPLEKEIVDNTKLDKKRLANEDSFNQLELLDNNSFNTISNEDHNLDTSPQEFDTKYVGNENITNSDYANNSSRDTKNEKQKLEEYNKDIFTKTIKQDILVLKDDNESLNTLKQEERVKPNNFDSVKPVTEDFSLPRFTRCAVDQFPCLNGTYIKDGSYCIPKNDRCDSVHDCSDGSDEVNCIEEGCPNNFQCSSGQCLKRYLVCDGIINCNDGSDEINCDKWTCKMDEISCGADSRCIPIPWKCDGRLHCSDGSDEHHCHQYTCSNDTFHCIEQDTCIPLTWKCDGKSDCTNGDDEKFCECTKEQFKCKIGGGCINMEEVCDGTQQCPDKSDEWNCLRLEELENSEETSHRNILQVHYRNSTWYPVCMDWSNWNTTYADKICQNMGFAGATLLESVPKSKDFKTDGYYKLVTPSATIHGQSILSQLEKTGDNNCDQLVSITCQEFACGNTASIDASSGRIDVNGNKTLPTQLPSLGLLYDIKRNTYCSASILTPLWAIASYSCMVAPSRSVDSSEWTLSAGSTNFNQLDNSTAQTRRIKQIIPHPQAKFSRSEFINNVVLIQLSQPLILNRNISTVCLPSKDTETVQQCVTAGWRVSKPGEAFKQQYIHHISGPTIDSEECNSTKHYNGMITKDKICAVHNKKDTSCYNDEGAPLMCFSNATETWELQGIQSHQENCGENTQPTTYSSINLQLRNWITSTIGKKALVRKL